MSPFFDNLRGLIEDFRPFDAYEQLVGGLVEDLAEGVALGLRHLSLFVVEKNLEMKKVTKYGQIVHCETMSLLKNGFPRIDEFKTKSPQPAPRWISRLKPHFRN